MTNDEFNADQQLEMQRLRVEESKSAWILWIIVGIVTLVSLVGIFFLLGGDHNRISDAGYARGLITVLFSVGVVAMALIVVLAVLMRQDSGDPQISEKKFQRAKEILSLLLGILGTIVGFYFGTSTSVEVRRASVVEIIASNQAPAPGDEVELTVLLEGGRPPLSYDIAFSGFKLETISRKTNGQWIKEIFSVPLEVGPSKSFTTTVTVEDATGEKSLLSKEFPLTLPPNNSE